MPTNHLAISLLALTLGALSSPCQDARVPVGAPHGTVHVDRPRADEPTVWIRGDRYKASVDAALKFKYRPRVIDGEAVAVPGVRNLFRYELER